MIDIAEMKYIPECIYANIDHMLCKKAKTLLINAPNKKYSQHAAWNFCGYIWFTGVFWIEQIWQYNSVIEEIQDTNLENLINVVCHKYGSG